MEINGFLSNLENIAEDVNTQDRWPQLLDEIDRGNVIPVIGPDLLVEPKVSVGDEGRIENLHQQIISYIARWADVRSGPRTFSQLVYDKDFLYKVNNKRNKIYSLINEITKNLDKVEEINHEPSRLLMNLLETRKFPFVITTSFTPIVEQAMEKIWGEGNVKVYTFTNDPQACRPEKGGDIRTEEDLMRPSVLYMLGKYCDNPQKYVITDKDMMIYCGSWIKGYGVPKNLTEALKKKKKYLLILGNNYSDWLYRFVWFALRTSPDVMKSDVIVNEEAEESLIQFLERLHTFYHGDPSQVIQHIKKEMEARGTESPALVSYDVFISYSRTDEAIATKLYEALTSKGLNVWFDRESIGMERWEDAIKMGIRNSRLFIPILSKNVENELIVPHEYRKEWKLAAQKDEKMGGVTFIIPFAEKGFSFSNQQTKLPEVFAKMNAVWYSSVNDVETITQKVLNEVEHWKEMEKKFRQHKKNN